MIWLWCWLRRRSLRRCRPRFLPGRCVGASDTGKLLAEAFERAGARFRVTDPDAQLAFDVLREARDEARAELARRIERERRRIRKAARRIAEAEALDTAIAL